MKLFACLVAMMIVWTAWSVSAVTHAGDGRDLSAVNSSLKAADGETYGEISTVNGDVRVGRGATADEAHTVNGSVTIDDDARIGEVRTVNGSLTIREGVSVERSAHTVNGDVDVGRRTRVGGDLATVSGDIALVGAEVGGQLRTTNGDIDLTDGSRVHGGILVKKNRGWGWGREDRVRVTICSTCVVEGELRFERPVELRVEKGGRIGQVTGADVTRK